MTGAATAATPPGEIAGTPKLVIRYPTPVSCIEALLPPSMTPWGDPVVLLGIYRVPVNGEPEHGISTKVPAVWRGIEGWYTIGIGIDQESAIFISRETNGQPKFPCAVRYYRLGDRIEASCTHQGHTFLSYSGTITGDGEAGGDVGGDEWWVKYSRAVGGPKDNGNLRGSDRYDFAPHVVRVHTEGTATSVQTLSGELTLRDSPWDPYTEVLPMAGPAEAELLTTRFTARTITLDEPLDPEAFWAHADTIGGSRWPGLRGGPRP